MKIWEEPSMASLEFGPLSYISIQRLHLLSRLWTTNAECRRKTEAHIISRVCQEYHQNEEEFQECTHITFFRLKTGCLAKNKAWFFFCFFVVFFVSPVYFCHVDHWNYFLGREFSSKPPTSLQMSCSQLWFLLDPQVRQKESWYSAEN